MPSATGFITNREVKQIRQLVIDGVSNVEIAAIIGCARSQISRYSGNLGSIRDRAERYDRIVSRAAAYVPTFGGGR